MNYRSISNRQLRGQWDETSFITTKSTVLGRIRGESIKRISITLLTPSVDRRGGDTLYAAVQIMNEDGLIAGNVCLDSIRYSLLNSSHSDTSPELIINKKSGNFGISAEQCFVNGRDTIKMIISDSSARGNTFQVTVNFKALADTTIAFSLITTKVKLNNLSLRNKNPIVFLKNGHILFDKNLSIPMDVAVISINGQLIHRGSYIPCKSVLPQYTIPISRMAHGTYILTISSQDLGRFYTKVILQ